MAASDVPDLSKGTENASSEVRNDCRSEENKEEERGGIHSFDLQQAGSSKSKRSRIPRGNSRVRKRTEARQLSAPERPRHENQKRCRNMRTSCSRRNFKRSEGYQFKQGVSGTWRKKMVNWKRTRNRPSAFQKLESAPVNTTQFLMADRDDKDLDSSVQAQVMEVPSEDENPATNRRRHSGGGIGFMSGSGSRSDTWDAEEYFYGQTQDEAEFMTREFTSIYDSARQEQLQTMTKTDLIQELLSLEDKDDGLQRRLAQVTSDDWIAAQEAACGGGSSPRLDSETAEKIRIMQLEIGRLQRENQRLLEIVGPVDDDSFDHDFLSDEQVSGNDSAASEFYSDVEDTDLPDTTVSTEPSFASESHVYSYTGDVEIGQHEDSNDVLPAGSPPSVLEAKPVSSDGSSSDSEDSESDSSSSSSGSCSCSSCVDSSSDSESNSPDEHGLTVKNAAPSAADEIDSKPKMNGITNTSDVSDTDECLVDSGLQASEERSQNDSEPQEYRFAYYASPVLVSSSLEPCSQEAVSGAESPTLHHTPDSRSPTISSF